MLTDRFARTARKLRISVTDRCNFRCAYCMPAHPVWLPKDEVLTFEEIERIARIAAACGIRKIRLTGGEPTVRRGLPGLVRRLAAVPGLEALGMTTNGYLLDGLAGSLADAGLRSLNISLDTLDRERFRAMARMDGLTRTLAGIDAAARAGFRIKLNAVVVRGLNEDEIPALCRFGRERGFPVRFIEYMPLDGDRAWSRERVVAEEEILERAASVAPLVSVEGRGAPPSPARASAGDGETSAEASSPARMWKFADGIGEVGVIASVTRPFCADCDRVRITADGKFRTCLFALEETDLLGPLRAGAPDEAVAALLRSAVLGKWDGHRISSAAFVPPERAMNAIGG